MRRFPKESIFQQQMFIQGCANPNEIQIAWLTENEEHKDLQHPPQRVINKHFL